MSVVTIRLNSFHTCVCECFFPLYSNFTFLFVMWYMFVRCASVCIWQFIYTLCALSYVHFIYACKRTKACSHAHPNKHNEIWKCHIAASCWRRVNKCITRFVWYFFHRFEAFKSACMHTWIIIIMCSAQYSTHLEYISAINTLSFLLIFCHSHTYIQPNEAF